MVLIPQKSHPTIGLFFGHSKAEIFKLIGIICNEKIIIPKHSQKESNLLVNDDKPKENRTSAKNYKNEIFPMKYYKNSEFSNPIYISPW